jgi:replicative DNA helicase
MGQHSSGAQVVQQRERESSNRVSGELYNRQAEALVLSGILRNSDVWFNIKDLGVSHLDFGGVENKAVMKAIEVVAGQKGEPEMTLVIEVLRGGGNSNYEEYLEKLITIPASTAQAIDAARLIKGLTVSRGLASAGVKLIEIAQEKRGDYDSALIEAENALRGVRIKVPSAEYRTDPASILKEWRSRGRIEGTEIKFLPKLQEYTGGLLVGHLWVIGGFSSTGKSAVGCNFVVDAIDQGKWVGIVSTEMTASQYMIRLISLLSGVGQLRVRDPVFLDSNEAAKIEAAEMKLSAANLRLYDNVYRLDAIRSTAMRQKQLHGLDVLLVDFIQNVRGSAGDFAYADTTEITLDLQQLAKDLDCTVIAFSQVSNAQAQMDSQGEREVYAFKGSGALKDAADVAVMLRRDRVNRSPVLELDVVKHRHGEMGKIMCTMHLETGRVEQA